MTLEELFEKDAEGSVKIDSYPHDGEEYEILDIEKTPVMETKGKVSKKLSKKNLFRVELAGLREPVYLSGTHPIVNPQRGKVKVIKDSK